MYYHNNQDTDINSSNNDVNNNSFQHYPLMDNTSFDELPTHFLNNESNTFINDSLFDLNFCNFEQPQTIDPQEAILLSDPTFLRQHQLLQEEQKDLLQTNTHTDETIKEEGKKPQQQKRNNRRQQVVGKASSSLKDDEKIDHQRRFNELQARFRVNYARKPQQSSQSKPKKLPKETEETTTTKQQKTLPPTKIEIPSPPSNLLSSPGPSVLNTPPIPGGTVMKAGEDFSVTKEYLSSSFPSRTMPIQIQRVSRANSSSHFDAESYQKQLDNQLNKVDFNDITVSELKEMLRQRGKPATGKKAVLLQRLQEERELAKGGRSPINNRSLHRHSQPLPLSRSYNSYSEIPQQRPSSFQGPSSSSPVMMASSVSPLLSPGGQLNRSIANMHIGSPPTTSRRYSPYSPRLSGSSPKSSSYFEYPLASPSSTTTPPPLPNTNNNNNGNGLMLSSSYSASRLTPGRYYNNTKSYKPFTSSALATPDREEDINPFDTYYAGSLDPPIKEEETTITHYHENDSNMDWSDPSLIQGNLTTTSFLKSPINDIE